MRATGGASCPCEPFPLSRVPACRTHPMLPAPRTSVPAPAHDAKPAGTVRVQTADQVGQCRPRPRYCAQASATGHRPPLALPCIAWAKPRMAIWDVRPISRVNSSDYGSRFPTGRSLFARFRQERLMDEEVFVLQERLQRLERRHSELLQSGTELTERCESLLKLTTELARHAADASVRASVSAEQARLAGNQAVIAARHAAARGEQQIADKAYAAAKAAADAATHASEAAATAWQAVLVAAAHGANRDLLSLSSSSGEATKAAHAEAADVVRNVTRVEWSTKKLRPTRH